MVPHADDCTGTPPTFGCPGCMWLATPQPASIRRRRTAHDAAMIAAGVHPATEHPLDPEHTCGECMHCETITFAASAKHRCVIARRQVRLSWTACDLRVVQHEPTNVGV